MTTEDKVIVISGEQTKIENHAYRGREMRHLIISAKISEIGHYAFKQCPSLHTVELPDSLEIIYSNAFAECTSLKNINIPNSVREIWQGAFARCESLESIRFPDAMVRGVNCLLPRCTSLTHVSLPISLIERGYKEPMKRHDIHPLHSIEIRL